MRQPGVKHVNYMASGGFKDVCSKTLSLPVQAHVCGSTEPRTGTSTDMINHEIHLVAGFLKSQDATTVRYQQKLLLASV